MKKSEINACLIASVLATSVLLTGCGGGSGGGLSGLGAAGAAGTAGATGATGAAASDLATSVNGDLSGLLGANGVDVNLDALGEDVNVNALDAANLADLRAAGILGAENVEVLETANGDLLGITDGARALALPGAEIPGLPALPAVPAPVAGVLRGL